MIEYHLEIKYSFTQDAMKNRFKTSAKLNLNYVFHTDDHLIVDLVQLYLKFGFRFATNDFNYKKQKIVFAFNSNKFLS